MAIKLSGFTLSMRLELENQSETAMPAGLGFHPYFPDLDTASLQFTASKVWLVDEQVLPERCADIPPNWDFRKMRSIGQTELDNCFTEWISPARIQWNTKVYGVEIIGGENLSFANIYTEPHSNSFCFEPVSHVPNAINLDRENANYGLRILLPGESMQASMRIDVFND